MKFTPADFVGVAGIVPTPGTPNADSWSTEHSVNLPETARMIELIIDAGIEILMCTGTFGECSTLTEPELRSFVDCIVQTTRGRRPLFAGITTLNTRDTIRRGRELMDIGADGLFVGRPMWLAMDQKAIVSYYRDLAEAMPGVPLVVYDNPVAFKGKISPEAYRELAKIPEVVAAKHVGGPELLGDARAVGDQCRILPLATAWYDAAVVEPDLMTCCWSGAVACAPAVMASLSKAIGARDWSRAQTVSDQCKWAEAAMFAGGDLAGFMDYSIQIAHLRFAAAGLIKPGPSRPPYNGDLPENYRTGGWECGLRWGHLQKEHTAAVALAS